MAVKSPLETTLLAERRPARSAAAPAAERRDGWRGRPRPTPATGDLARPGVKIIGAQASVPIGDDTTRLLKAASGRADFGADFQRRVERKMVTREETVHQIVAEIQLGEGDAAVAYTTDVTPAVAAQFVRIALPDDLRSVTNYLIAAARGHHPGGGQAFVAFVSSPPAQAILARWGFLPPPPEN